MNRSAFAFLIAFVALTACTTSAIGGGAANIEHGRYLVESVAMCGQCHTPRDGGGDLLRSQWLRGATVSTASPYPSKPWAEFAPRIAGLPQYSDTQALRLLTGGLSRSGKQLRAPMPPYRLSQEDAQDIIVYLKSLE